MILCDPLGSRPGWDLGAQDAHLRDVAGLLKVCLDGFHLVHASSGPAGGPRSTDVERVLKQGTHEQRALLRCCGS
jgi:hypothetical protein